MTIEHPPFPVAPANPATSDPPIFIAMLFRPHGATGVHTHVTEFRRHLAAQGKPTPLLTPFSWGRPLRAPVFGARYVLEPWAPTPNLLWYRHWHQVFLRNALRTQLSRHSSAIIYAQDPPSAYAALRARKTPKQRVILAIHFPGSEADEWIRNGRIAATSRGASIVRSQERRTALRVDGLVYVSDSVRHDLLARIPEAGRIPSATIPNFLSPPSLPAAPSSRGDLVTIARLEPIKNHHFLLNVLASARRSGTTLTLDIFGEGSQRHNLENQAQSLGIRDQVRLCGFHRDVRSILPSYRAYVHAALAEPFGFAIIEAMAAGLPVIAPRVGGIPELFTEREGRFWDLDDPDASARTLVAFLGNDALSQDAANNARTRFYARFETSVVAPTLLSFLLSGHAPAARPASDPTTSFER